jgi:hypothetical protein
MEILSTVVNAVVVAVVGLVLAWLGKGRFEAMDRRFDTVEGRIDRLEERLEARMDALRSDLTQVALAVGVRGRATNA